MKHFITRIIQQRNPQFVFDPSLSGAMLVSFIYSTALNMLRGAGLWLRGRQPKGAMLGQGVRFFHLRGIKWGRYMRLGREVYMSALGKNGIVLGDNVSIGDYSRIIISTSLHHIGESIDIGHNVGIGEYAYLGGAGGLIIGNDCIIGQYFSCHPENHIYSHPTELIRKQGVTRKGIKIGPDCWIGSKVTILDGVEIGAGSVIAAGAVVTRSFPPQSIIGGVPAKMLKPRNP